MKTFFVFFSLFCSFLNHASEADLGTVEKVELVVKTTEKTFGTVTLVFQVETHSLEGAKVKGFSLKGRDFHFQLPDQEVSKLPPLILPYLRITTEAGYPSTGGPHLTVSFAKGPRDPRPEYHAVFSKKGLKEVLLPGGQCSQLGHPLTPKDGGPPGSQGFVNECCPGLRHAEIKHACGMAYGGYAGVCIACGDKKCDPEYENKCNCPEDCKK